EVLLLGFPDPDGRVVLVALERPVPNGGKLF
ncbi:MAG: tRNA-binding protein, partial [Geminicoccaceae bacterium]